MNAAIKGTDKKGRISVDQVKVERYRAGKAPKNVPSDSNVGEEDFARQLDSDQPDVAQEPVIHSDRRLARLALIQRDESKTEIKETIAANEYKVSPTPNIVEHVIESTMQQETEEEKIEELVQPEDVSDRLFIVNRSVPSEYGRDQEYETSEEIRYVPSVKSVSSDANSNDLSTEKEYDLSDNLSIGRSLLCQVIASNENLEASKTAAPAQIDDSDPTDEQERELEFQSWKLRELLRYQRDKEKEISFDVAQAELAAFRNLSHEEKSKAWSDRIQQQAEVEKSKYEFLQKYYHKGAFFQDSTDAVLQRDYDAPSQNERIDRTALPESMQVRNFGKKGRSKWTHLTAEDTTAFDSSWGDKKLSINYKMANKMGGIDNRPFFDSDSKRRK